MQEIENQTQSAFIAIVGRPNVGKSTLLNALVGEKIAIVSNKSQTTRTRITGVCTKGQTQYVFIDTPGLHKPRNKLGEYMVRQVTDSVADVDCAVLVTEATGPVTAAERKLMEDFSAMKLPAVLALNKVDVVEQKESLLEKIAVFSQAFPFAAVVPISAKTGDGLGDLWKELQPFAADGPHYFPDDTLTDQPEKVIAAEMIREKLLQNLREEIPHGTAVVIESMKERETGEKELMDIDAVIFCERDSHKGMIIGKGGAMLKTVATQSRMELERFLGIPVNLQCWVKVKEDWRNREGLMRNFGFQ